MPSDNRYEQNIKNFADTFKNSIERIRPHIRGGDRPPFTAPIGPRVLADPLVAEQIAQDFERRGLPDQAALVRQKAARAQRTAPETPGLAEVDPTQGYL